MLDARVDVRPVAGGWLLDCPASHEPLMFLSGGKAESKAHQMARCLAALGAEVEVVVHDRAGQVVGTTRYLAAYAEGA
jgi:hypothetical protein